MDAGAPRARRPERLEYRPHVSAGRVPLHPAGRWQPVADSRGGCHRAGRVRRHRRNPGRAHDSLDLQTGVLQGRNSTSDISTTESSSVSETANGRARLGDTQVLLFTSLFSRITLIRPLTPACWQALSTLTEKLSPP